MYTRKTQMFEAVVGRVKRRSVWILGGILLVTSLILLASVSPLVPVQAVTQESPYVYGDANRDGSLTSLDFTFAKLIYLGKMAFVTSADANRDGSITAMDFTFAKLMYLGKMAPVTRHEATYNFSTRAGTSRIAMWKNVAALPSTNFDGEAGWTEATSAQYTSISVEDGGIWTIPGSTGTYTALQCKFTIDEAPNASDITSIGVTLVGSSQTAGDLLQFWAWNFGSGAWAQVGPEISMTTTTATYTAWSAWGKTFTNYIDASSYMYILLIHNTADKDLSVDYVKLVISTPTEMVDNTLPAAVTDLAATGYDPTSVTLSWTAPADDGSDALSGPATEYDIRYSTSEINASNFDSATQCTGEPAPGTPNTTDTFTVTSLTRGQTYYFALKTADDIYNWSNISNVISETPQQPPHKVGDWWMWSEYYNDEGEIGVENYCYRIENVVEVNQSTQVYWGDFNDDDIPDPPGNTSTHLACIDWHLDTYDETGGGRGRTRVGGTAVNYTIENILQDAQLLIQQRDNTMWVHTFAISCAMRTWSGVGDGDIPAHNYYHFNSSSYPWDAWDSSQDYSYPFTVGETWDQRQYTEASGEHTSCEVNTSLYFEYGWTVDQFISNYNTSNVSADGLKGCSHGGDCNAGLYDVYQLEVTCDWYGGDARCCDPDIQYWWYSEEAHNFVRKYDEQWLYGHEENVIVAYEVGDYSASGLTVTDKADNLDVSITITNYGNSPQKFNVLCLLLDMDMMTPVYGQEPMIDGYPVYPSMNNPDLGSTWPYYSAIQQTNTLNPGQSQVITWTDIYTCGSGPWKVWCQGLTDEWTNP